MTTIAELIARCQNADLIAAAMERKALLHEHEGHLYALALEPPVYWVYELTPSSEAYAVPMDGSRCTCPAPKPCKHMRMVKYGSDRTRPSQRGER